MPDNATARTTESPAADRDQVEAWFVAHGVPWFSESYALKDVAMVGCALLVVVGAFELTVLPWLDVGIRDSLVVLGAMTVLLLLILPELRGLWGPWRVRDRRKLVRPLIVRSAPLAVSVLALFAFTSRGVRWPGWIDFLVLVTFLVAAALVSRCQRIGAWDAAPTRQKRRLLLLPGLLVPLLAINMQSSPPMSSFVLDPPVGVVSHDLVPAPASMAALPFALFFLISAFTLPAANGGSAEPVGVRRDLFPAILVVVGLQATILPYLVPYLPEPEIVTYAVPTLLLYALASAASIAASRPGAAIGRWTARHRRIVYGSAAAAGCLVFMLAMPTLAAVDGVRLSFGQGLVVNAAYLLLAALVVGFALDRIIEAMVVEAFRGLPAALAALAQGLPLLAIVLVFLAITTEVWQVSASLDRTRFVLLAGALIVLTVGFAWLRGLLDVHRMRHFTGWSKISLAVSDKEPGLQKLVQEAAAGNRALGDVTVKLNGLQFLNASFVMTAYQLIYAALVTVGMSVVFYAIGKLAIDEDLLRSWGVAPGPHMPSFSDRPLLDQPWARVALLLGLFSAFQFLVQFTQDDDLRKNVMAGPDNELKQRFAVRAAYLDRCVEPAAPRPSGRFSLPWR
jgi:hypothetical protein